MDPNEVEVVYTTNDAFAAEVIKNALNSEGIACELAGEGQGGLSTVEDVQILVRAEDVDRALEIIRSSQAAEDDQDAEDDQAAQDDSE